MPLGEDRVHIAPVGYEKERVYQPIIEDGADSVVLLVHRDDSESQGEEISKAQECKNKIERELVSESINFVTKECDFFDVTSSATATAESIEQHPDAAVFVNISTGSKLTAIGGFVACTATSASPYYVHVESYGGETITTGFKQAEEIPKYPISLPHQQYLQVLKFISGREEVNKKAIVSECQDYPLLSKYTRDQEKNMYEPVTDEIIEPLVAQGYLSELPRGNEKKYVLTEDGKEALRVLEYLVS